MDADDTFTSTKDHARSKYHHGRLPLFNNKTRGAHSCMITVKRLQESRLCDPHGMWGPSRTSQTEHEVTTAPVHPYPHDGLVARRKSSSASSDSSGRSHSCSPTKDHRVAAISPSATPPRMHYEKPQPRYQSKKESQRACKELSHHRDRVQRREDLMHGF